MPNLHDIERRISSVSSTMQITHTMEMVAAAKINKSSERSMKTTPYSDSVGEIVGNIVSLGVDSPYLSEHEELKNVLLIAVVSDRGLAGGFNSNVLRAVMRMKDAKEAQGAAVKVIACGKKAGGFLRFRNVEPVMEFLDLSADPTVEEAATIEKFATKGFGEGDFDEVIIAYNHAKNSAEQQLRFERVLPASLDRLIPDPESSDAVVAQAAAEASETEAEAPQNFEFEPSAEEVISLLIPSYVQTTVYHALVDSAAAEQGARRTAMKSATDNATEMVETLTRVYNRVRQGAITTEITEIVGGAAALEE